MNTSAKFMTFMIAFYPKLSELLFMLTQSNAQVTTVFRKGFVPFITNKMETNIKK